MNNVGNFFVKIGQGIKKGFFGVINWVKNTAWIQPLLIVGLIFGVILSIKPVATWVDGLLNPDETYAFYNENDTSLEGLEEKLLGEGKTGTTMVVYYSEDDTTCATVEKTLRNFATSNPDVKWYCVNVNYEEEEDQETFDNNFNLDSYEAKYLELLQYEDLVDKSYENNWTDDSGKELTIPLPLFVRYTDGDLYGVKPGVNSSKTYDDLERFILGDKETDWNKTLDQYISSKN